MMIRQNAVDEELLKKVQTCNWKTRLEGKVSVGLTSFSHLFLPFLSIFLKKIPQVTGMFPHFHTHQSSDLSVHVSALRRYAIKRACVIHPPKGRDEDSWNQRH